MEQMMGKILTFDVGTTSMKCCVFDEAFTILDSVSAEYALQTPESGIVEVDPQIYWDGLCHCIRQLLDGGLKAQEIDAVGITTQGETTIVLDDCDRPLLPAVVWLDERAGKQAQEILESAGFDRIYRSTGLTEITGALPLAKLKWLMEQPELKARAKKVLLLEDYLIYRLTGAFVTEQSLICSTGYYDIVRHQYDEELLRLAGADSSILPKVLPCGSVAGTVCEEAACTGLAVGTPVVCTAMDQTASAIGAGNVKPGIVTETTGTCLTVAASVAEPDFSLDPPVPYYTHYDGSYLLLAYNQTAAIVMKWFKDTFMKDSRAAQESGMNLYDYMSLLASEAPAGCDGVVLLPHYTGKTMPDANPDKRGVFAGVGLGTTKGHFIRAIMEGVSFMLKEDLAMLEKAGVTCTEIRSFGGGAKDPLWCAIKANVLNCPVVTTVNQESTSLGAAILSRKAICPETSVADLCRSMIAVRDRYLPEEKTAEQYQTFYSRYLKLDRLMEVYYS